MVARNYVKHPSFAIMLFAICAAAGLYWSTRTMGPPISRLSSNVTAAFPWKRAIATVFWVGEAPSPDNGGIPNHASAWDVNWEANFGGLDDPVHRCGYAPCSFRPKENPFYVALPYDDLTEQRVRKKTDGLFPWTSSDPRRSVLKNRWVAVRANEKTCYGQWQDVGPFQSDDAAYVFGEAIDPINDVGEKAGIDLSPALRDCLGVGDVSHVLWRHVEYDAVPAGPWREVITKRPGPS